MEVGMRVRVVHKGPWTTSGDNKIVLDLSVEEATLLRDDLDSILGPHEREAEQVGLPARAVRKG